MIKVGYMDYLLLKRDMLLIGSLTGAVVFNIVSKYIQNFQKTLNIINLTYYGSVVIRLIIIFNKKKYITCLRRRRRRGGGLY